MSHQIDQSMFRSALPEDIVTAIGRLGLEYVDPGDDPRSH